MRVGVAVAVVFLLLTSVIMLGQGDSPGNLQITPVPPQSAILGQNFTLPLAATGGSPPYTWEVLQGNLPPGLKLHPHAAKITGVPTTPGEYHFTLAVVDSDVPQVQARRDFTIQVIAGLTIEWKDTPAVHGTAISGSAVVSNQTGNDFDVTVVIVAVNKIGRATALGYQHFRLGAQSSSPIIPFGSSPGPETYYVRADAAAHRPGHQHIYRASKQTPATITVSQF